MVSCFKFLPKNQIVSHGFPSLSLNKSRLKPAVISLMIFDASSACHGSRHANVECERWYVLKA